MPFSCSTTSSLTFLQNLILRLLASAPFYIQRSAAWLAKRYCSLLPPNPFCSAAASGCFSLSCRLPAGLLLIFTAMSYAPNAVLQQPFFSFLGGRLCFVSFRVRLVFLVTPANGKCTIHHTSNSSFLRLRRCFLRVLF